MPLRKTYARARGLRACAGTSSYGRRSRRMTNEAAPKGGGENFGTAGGRRERPSSSPGRSAPSSWGALARPGKTGPGSSSSNQRSRNLGAEERSWWRRAHRKGSAMSSEFHRSRAPRRTVLKKVFAPGGASRVPGQRPRSGRGYFFFAAVGFFVGLAAGFFTVFFAVFFDCDMLALGLLGLDNTGER